MSSGASAYNYDHYNFSLEPPEYERWLRDAPAIGRGAPDFLLPDLEGNLHSLREHGGRPVVIEFGSYTCPIFGAQITAMEELKRRHPDVTFLVIYTREAHPGERTPAHRSGEEKVEAARKLVGEESLDRTVLIDELDGRVHQMYGGAWDSVFVINGDGKVVLRRAWNDPQQVEDSLLALRSGESPEPIDSIEMVRVPSRGGFGHGLLRGGTTAVLDFYNSAPPPIKEMFRKSESREVRDLVVNP